MIKQPTVSIIVLNWNGWRDTVECLKSVYKINYPNFQFVLVDNDSGDGSVSQVSKWAKKNLVENQVFVEYNQISVLQGGEEEKGGTLGHISSNSRMVLIRYDENLGCEGGNNVAIHYASYNKYFLNYIFQIIWKFFYILHFSLSIWRILRFLIINKKDETISIFNGLFDGCIGIW